MEEKESVEYAKISATASAEKLSEYLKKLDISETETKKLIDLILDQVRDCIELGKEIAYSEMIAYMKDNLNAGDKNAD
ncbi:hypothetical protein MWG07_11580 [Fusobacterium necrophorum]|uniref:Uncharacterized protein n=1 Tax=Fusobacterium necrophorum TaxID=859 RepID=A0AAW6WGD7_9FUSO|nr:hypothetical protein [Fusobacterium necrophorum]MDK4481799.1 hypothetical protein [Fusobacterium necrophorum]MDK4512889.1 hypothetical protein [Fusobacterium necrophorum]